MKFRSKKQFITYAQFIPITLGIILLLSLAYVLYFAPGYTDEAAGRVYAIESKSRIYYLTLIEEVLICGSALGAAVSFVIL